MAIDYIIGGLMLSSAAINILALAAFWISPGLRTTANRFVINLLIVNIFASIIMLPSLFINGGLKIKYSDEIVSEEIVSAQRFFNLHSISKRHVEDETIKHHQRPIHHYPKHLSVSPIEKSKFLIQLESKVIEEENKIIHDFEQRTGNSKWTDEINVQTNCNRFWGFDVAAALGKRHLFIYIFILFTRFRSKFPFNTSLFLHTVTPSYQRALIIQRKNVNKTFSMTTKSTAKRTKKMRRFVL